MQIFAANGFFTWRSIYMTAARAVMLVKKVTYLGEFGYLNSSCIRTSIILMFLSSSREEFTIFWQNAATDVSVGFRHVGAHPDEDQGGVSIQITINLGKTLLRISCITKAAVNWILARVQCAYFTFFLFSDSGALSVERFWFLIWSILNGVILKTSNLTKLIFALSLAKNSRIIE